MVVRPSFPDLAYERKSRRTSLAAQNGAEERAQPCIEWWGAIRLLAGSEMTPGDSA